MVDSPWTQGRPERPAGTTRWAAGAERAVAILRSRPVPVLVFLWNQVVLVLWWVGQWPGLLSADSVRYLIHVTAGPWTADHSVLYDSFVLASLDLSRNVALLTLAQTTAAAAVVAFTVATIQRYGVPGRWAAVPGLVLPCLPSFGAFVSTVWKDVPFALVEVLVAATMLRIVHRPRRPDGRHDISRGLLVALGLELTGLNLFRNDGFLMVVLLTVALAVALKGVRQKMVAVGVASLLIFAVCHSVIYPAIGIAPASSTLAYGTFYADIAIAYGKDPGEFTAADQAIMSQVTPLKNWRKARNCYSSDPLFRYPGFDKIAADRLKNQLAALWFRTFARSPVTVVWARLCRSSVAWSPLPPPDHRPRTAGTRCPATGCRSRPRRTPGRPSRTTPGPWSRRWPPRSAPPAPCRSTGRRRHQPDPLRLQRDHPGRHLPQCPARPARPRTRCLHARPAGRDPGRRLADAAVPGQHVVLRHLPGPVRRRAAVTTVGSARGGSHVPGQSADRHGRQSRATVPLRRGTDLHRDAGGSAPAGAARGAGRAAMRTNSL